MKKIGITDLLGLSSLMLIGCNQNQAGTTLMEKGTSKATAISNIKKSIFKNPFRKDRDKVKVTNGSVIVEYKIVDDKLFPRHLYKPGPESEFDSDLWEQERTNRDKHQRYFDFFAKIIPREFREGIKYVIIFDPKSSHELANMGPKHLHTLEVFELGMQFNLFDNQCSYNCGILNYPYIVDTMLHEFGHYVTKNIKQRYFLCPPFDLLGPFYRRKAIIKKIKSIYHCPKAELDAYMKDICKEKEVAYSLKQKRIHQRKLKKEFIIQDKKNKFYEGGTYITEYATTSDSEDAAETFVYFVLFPEQPDPNVCTLWDKVRLFWKNPEMVEMREAIQKNLKKLNIHPNMSQDELKKLGVYPSTPNSN